MKQRILLVGDYNRSDFLYVAKLFHSEIDFFFIENLNKNYLKTREALQYGNVIYWKDYHDAYDLLDKVSPQKTLFYFIESYNHVALNVACRVNRIPSFHLEHGLRFSLSYYKGINESIPEKRSFFKRLSRIHEIFDKIRNRLFFEKTKIKSPAEERIFLDDFYKVRSRNNIFETFQKLRSDLRLPDEYISFSPLIFNYHKELENLPDDYPVRFIGIPQFDSFSRWNHLIKSGDDILLIDQPLHEQHLYGWTLQKKKSFLNDLVKKIGSLKNRIFVKPHPFNDLTLYREVSSLPGVEIISFDWEKVVPAISTVLGFSSTLLLPFMAMDHITCFTLEMHPDKREIPYSAFLLDSGVCDAVNDFEDLSHKLTEREQWHTKQKNYKKQFIENYMYKFDGNSSMRLKKILLDEIS